MAEPFRIIGHKKGATSNEQVQAQVLSLLTHNALAVMPVNSLGAVSDPDGGTLVPEVYDYIELSYTSSNLTGVVYKTGGSGGTTVATLTLAYDGSNNLTSVTRT